MDGSCRARITRETGARTGCRSRVQGLTHLFFPSSAERPQARNAVRRWHARCATCVPCASRAGVRPRHHEYGFWGGESEDERHAAGYRLIAPIGVRARPSDCRARRHRAGRVRRRRRRQRQPRPRRPTPPRGRRLARPCSAPLRRARRRQGPQPGGRRRRAGARRSWAVGDDAGGLLLGVLADDGIDDRRGRTRVGRPTGRA